MSVKTSSSELQIRDSNMELLRIVSMLLVLIVHADYMSLGSPTTADVFSNPTESFLKMLFYSLSTVCVNCFVLLSGWYGIHPKLKRFSAFIFQVLFISGLSLTGYYLFTHQKPTIEDLKSLLLLTDDLWFVRSYIVLYLFAPMLNTFSTSASKHQFTIVLGCLLFIQTILGWATSTVPWFDGGYSPLSFMLLYLLAQYTRRFSGKWTTLSSQSYLLIYLSITLFGALINFFSFYLGIGEGMSWLSYISPIVIANSLALLLFFSKLQIKSRAINWVASSCFAVYILHCSRHALEAYCHQISLYYQSDNYCGIILLILCIYLAAILIDKIRIRIWQLVFEEDEKTRR